MFSHDNQNIQYHTYREEVFGSGINPSIRHCFLAYMKNKNNVSFYCQTSLHAGKFDIATIPSKIDRHSWIMDIRA